jgi:hypothetical protein
MIFEPFPKLARLARECVVTEKLDGTNAQIIIIDPENSEPDLYEACMNEEPLDRINGLHVYAGSRTRLIWPGKTSDNYGFAAWVRENIHDLVQLGEGRHFGEWWGQGIQRNYGLAEKRFSLFHTYGIAHKPDCVSVAPTLYAGAFSSLAVDAALQTLKDLGSHAVPGFMNPEGVVVYHEHAKVSFKKTFDDRHKEAA